MAPKKEERMEGKREKGTEEGDSSEETAQDEQAKGASKDY